jgi:hypothetical protein
MHEALGADDHDTLTAIANLAAMLWQYGERGEAYWLQCQVVETRRRAQGEDDPATRAAMAVLEAMHRDGMP